jgi:hypothetical protein
MAKTTMSIIEEQKKVADFLLRKLEIIDPFCILAGGAPRDWLMSKEATDLDFYLYTPVNIGIPHFIVQLQRIGITGVSLTPISALSAESGYRHSGNIRFVMNYERGGIKCQFMMMNESTYKSVVDNFCLGLSRAWYKNKRLNSTFEYDWSVANQVLIRTDVQKTSPEYLFDWYIDKIKAKFPDYFYIKDLQGCEEYEELTGKYIPMYIKNKAYVKPMEPVDETEAVVL